MISRRSFLAALLCAPVAGHHTVSYLQRVRAARLAFELRLQKTLRFAQLYGAGPRTLRRMLGQAEGRFNRSGAKLYPALNRIVQQQAVEGRLFSSKSNLR